MTDHDEVHALTASIGEHSVDNIGKENLAGLQVFLSGDEALADVTIALRDNSEESQRAALVALFEVEQLFFDEAVLSFHFVDDIDERGDARVKASRVQYSYV